MPMEEEALKEVDENGVTHVDDDAKPDDSNFNTLSTSQRILLAAMVCLSIFTAWTLAVSLWSITVLFLTVPGMALFVLTLLLLVCSWWPLLSSGGSSGGVSSGSSSSSSCCKKVVNNPNKWQSASLVLGSTAMAFAAVLLPIVIVYTFSPYTMPASDATLLRLGSISDDTVRVWVRSGVDGATSFVVHYRNDTTGTDDDWLQTDVVPLVAADDYTGVATITLGLAPDTSYEYRVDLLNLESASLNDNNELLLSGTFSTLPLPNAPSKVRFAWSSCSQKSANAGYELDGFANLAQYFAPQLKFLIHLGDLIYTDVPLSIVGLGADADAYHAHYRRTFQDESFAEYGRSIPTFYQYDDHEIVNDVYEPDHPSFDTAVTAWKAYAGKSNNPSPPNENNHDANYYTAEAGGACIFVAETRGHRTETSILGPTQLSKMIEWLTSSSSSCVFKIIATPVPVTPNYENGREGWGTYDDLEILLNTTKANNITGPLVFLSGDAHVQGVYELAPGVLEFTASPIASPPPPFMTIGGSTGQTVWEQIDFTASTNSQQFGIVDVDTLTDEENPTLTIGLYSNGGSGAFTTPRIEFQVRANNNGWEISGGTEQTVAVAPNSTAMSLGRDNNSLPKRHPTAVAGASPGFTTILTGSPGGLSIAGFVLFVIFCFATCWPCCASCRRGLTSTDDENDDGDKKQEGFEPQNNQASSNQISTKPIQDQTDREADEHSS
mmetsp:Transcript_753/g.1051  ORF Transcript_753/g.1051 Transcript_753/m.1051 type:complete len:721 (+) Transcript_753:121-2283(+)